MCMCHTKMFLNSIVYVYNYSRTNTQSLVYQMYLTYDATTKFIGFIQVNSNVSRTFTFPMIVLEQQADF